MSKKLTMIKLGDIRENPLNIHAEDDAEQIRLMAESINLIGLESPLVVYEDEFAGKKIYRILSGHKRYKALKASGKPPIFDVVCIVEDKPKDELTEREILLQNNIARKEPEEIQKQAKEASGIWDRMPVDRREKYSTLFRNQFIIDEKKRTGSIPDEKYIRDNFRPRLEYIKRMTGLSVSNSTVKNVLRKELLATSEALPEEPAKEKTIRIDDILKRINTLSGIIEVYLGGEEIQPSEMSYLEDLQFNLKNTVAGLTA